MRLRKLAITKVNFEAATHISKSAGVFVPCTYVLWDLDEGEDILCGLCWQGPGAEGRGDGGQTSGRHNFSLREDEQRTQIRPDIEQFQACVINHECKYCSVFVMMTVSKQT